MKKELTLVILAAGMGSRFGGLKQIEPVGPNGEFILDYSIYDAIQAGFTKVVFLIKEEMYDLFRETIGKRIEGKIPVAYCFQRLEDIPNGFEVPKDRIKPWGTAQAVLECKDEVSGNFVMINSDDFYGRDAFFKVAEYFKSAKENDYAIVTYPIANTLSENGSVKRGVCEIKNGLLTKIIESKVESINDDIVISPLDGSKAFNAQPDTIVSMNIFGFTDRIFKRIEDNFPTFLEKNKDNLSNCEYLIPDVVSNEIENNIKVHILRAQDKWIGVTYREDKEFVVREIRKMIDEGIYPEKLWNQKILYRR